MKTTVVMVLLATLLLSQPEAGAEGSAKAPSRMNRQRNCRWVSRPSDYRWVSRPIIF